VYYGLWVLVFGCLAILFGYIGNAGVFGYGLRCVLCVLHGGALVWCVCALGVRSGCAQSKTGNRRGSARMR